MNCLYDLENLPCFNSFYTREYGDNKNIVYRYRNGGGYYIQMPIADQYGLILREIYPYEVDKIKRGKRPVTLGFRNGISLYEIEQLCMRQCIRELFLQVIDINILDEEVSHDLSKTNIKSDVERDLRKTIEKLTNTSHIQKWVKRSVYNGFGNKNTIMPPTTAPHRLLMVLSDSSAGY